MTKFAKVFNRAQFLEEATKRVLDVAYDHIRWNEECLNYEDTEEADRYNDEWLEAHLTSEGQEWLDLARDVAAEIETLL